MLRRPIFAFLSILALVLSLPTTAPAADEAHVELILDASGSMWNKLDDGRFRITAAKEVLGTFVEGLPDAGLNVGLRVYGSRVKAGEPGACRDTELMVPIQGVDKAALRRTVEGAKAIGATPIALSLEQAATDFPAGAARKLLVLVTDGEEACDGDVRAAAEKLRAAGVDVDLRIIGFDLDAKAMASFEGLGTFENAADAKALAGALGRAVESIVPPLGDAALEAPAEVAAGSSVEVRWTGEGGTGDYVTLVPKGAEDGTYAIWQYVEAGNPLTLAAPFEPGEYELRYQSDRASGIAARRPLRVTPSEIAVRAPSQVVAGRAFEAAWRGPNGAGDYLTLVAADAPAGDYGQYAYTSAGNPVTFTAPITGGAFEVRYQSERESAVVFARARVEVLPIETTLEAPAEVAAGATFEVEWRGPDGPGDYVTIVRPGAGPQDYTSYFYTSSGSPGTLTAPDEPGEWVIRYQSETTPGVYARRTIRVR